MDTIVAQTRSIAEVAGSARTPAAGDDGAEPCGGRSPAQSVSGLDSAAVSQAAGRALSYGSGELLPGSGH